MPAPRSQRCRLRYKVSVSRLCAEWWPILFEAGRNSGVINASIPGAAVDICCYQCGVKNFPNIKKDDWCWNTCCCIHQECGLKDWKTIQWLCCVCKDFKNCSQLTKFPEFCAFRCLLYKVLSAFASLCVPSFDESCPCRLD